MSMADSQAAVQEQSHTVVVVVPGLRTGSKARHCSATRRAGRGMAKQIGLTMDPGRRRATSRSSSSVD